MNDLRNNETEESGDSPANFQDCMKLFFKEICNLRQKNDSGQHSFNLPTHDPDNSKFSTDEWIEHINDLKEQVEVSDCIMILKAGEALQGSGKTFFDGWKPFTRNWANFVYDLRIRFPNQETWHTKLLKAATMESSDFNSLCEYAMEKIRCIYQFEPQLVWEKVLCPVIGGVTNDSTRQRIRMNIPKDQRELMSLLRQCDNEVQDDQRRIAKRPRMDTTRPHGNNERAQRERHCFNCGKNGHLRQNCRRLPNLTT